MTPVSVPGFDGRVVLITGAGAGLGRECARQLASAGARLVLADVVEERARAVAGEVRAAGGEAEPIGVDVRDEAEVAAAFDLAEERWGRPDAVMANAGIRAPGGAVAFEDLSVEAWTEVFDVNVLGVFLTCREAARRMAGRGGAILITSSAAAIRAYPGIPAYSATKGALNALTRSLAIDLGPSGIRVNAICPTLGMARTFKAGIDAPVDDRSHEEVDDSWDPEAEGIPLRVGRPPTVADNAHAALFLLSDASAYTSGICMPITDGGALSRVGLTLSRHRASSPSHPGATDA